MSKWTEYKGKIFNCKHCGCHVGWKRAKSGKFYTVDVFEMIPKHHVLKLIGQGKGFVPYHQCKEEAKLHWAQLKADKMEAYSDGEMQKADEFDSSLNEREEDKYWGKVMQKLEQKGEEKAYASKFAKECAEYLIAQTTNIPTERGNDA